MKQLTELKLLIHSEWHKLMAFVFFDL